VVNCCCGGQRCVAPAPIGHGSKPEVDFDAEPPQSLDKTNEQQQKKHKAVPPFYSWKDANLALERGVLHLESGISCKLRFCIPRNRIHRIVLSVGVMLLPCCKIRRYYLSAAEGYAGENVWFRTVLRYKCLYIRHRIVV
jgi:hypothetical protein